MMPILRMLPVGGVFIAIMLLVLALNPQASTGPQLTSRVLPVHSAMIAPGEYPELRQPLMRAAIRRADEVNRSREPPEGPARGDPAPAAPEASTVAALPSERTDADPNDDPTGSIAQPPAANIPIDIGEPSAFELPVAAPEEKPAVIKTPLRIKPGNESRIRSLPRRHRAKVVVEPKPSGLMSLFQIFSEEKPKHQAAAAH